MVTVPGGGSVPPSVTDQLTPEQQTALANSIQTLVANANPPYTSTVFVPPDSPSTVPGVLNVGTASPSGGSVSAPDGVQVFIVTGDQPVKITGNPSTQVLVGSDSNDTIVSGGMAGTIVSGNGNTVIDASSSNQDPDIQTGTGNDTVTLGFGVNTVTAQGNLTLKGGGGDDTVSFTGSSKTLLQQAMGNIEIDVTGDRDTINIKNGKDTIDVTGKGTKINSSLKGGVVVNESGPVSMVFKGAGNDTVSMGDGSNTINDSGNLTVQGGGPSGNGHNKINVGGTRLDIRADGNNLISVGASRNARSHPTVNLTVGGGTDTTATGGNNDTIIATSKVNLTTTGDPGNINFVGIGNDSFTLNGGGNADNQVNIDSDKARITINGGAESLNVLGDHAKITESPNAGGSIITAIGNDTINLGTGNDTVTDLGGATVFGGGGNFQFVGGGGGRDQVVVGSGNATLVGGGGVNVFHAGSGSTSMTGGAGSRDTFFGGSGLDTMDAQGATSAVFQFAASNHGGTHTINHFQTGPDKLSLSGYDTAAVLASAQVIGGNTVLNLGDGTTITLAGFTHLTASDFK
jgi:hypothetical protein